MHVVVVGEKAQWVFVQQEALLEVQTLPGHVKWVKFVLQLAPPRWPLHHAVPGTAAQRKEPDSLHELVIEVDGESGPVAMVKRVSHSWLSLEGYKHLSVWTVSMKDLKGLSYNLRL